MIGGVLELAQEGRSLGLAHGFACIYDHHTEIGRVPLDDLTAVLLTAHQITLTKPVLSALMERGIPLICCGDNYHPDGLMLPYRGYYRQAGILKQQVALSEVHRKRLWQQIVRAKIAQQEQVLAQWQGDEHIRQALRLLQQQVQSGDPHNIEAQAARLYWQTLMGTAFRRDQQEPGINACLNYGYAVVRAATARAAISVGLTPALGIHHCNESNAFALIDDLMEPYRPAVDHVVRAVVGDIGETADLMVTPAVKKRLVAVLLHDCAGPDGITPLMIAVRILASSLVAALGERNAPLVIPAVSLSTEVP